MAVTSVTHAVFPGEAVERILEGSPETIANAAVLTMAATPVTIVSAVAGHLAVFEGMVLQKAAGAYTAVAATDVIQVRYTDNSGTQVAEMPGTGFLDSADEEETYVEAFASATGDSSKAGAVNAPIVLILSGVVTSADGGALKVRAYYRMIPLA